MQKHLSWASGAIAACSCGKLHGPWLRERHPKGTVVMINLLTAEYLVGQDTAKLMAEFTAKFWDADWCLDNGASHDGQASPTE